MFSIVCFSIYTKSFVPNKLDDKLIFIRSDRKRNEFLLIPVFHDSRFCQIILKDLKLHREKQNKFHKKLPPVGIERKTSRSSCHCSIDWAKSPFGSVWITNASIKSCSIDSRNEQSPVVHETKLTSEISFPTHTRLTQPVEHYSDDQEVLGSIPIGDNFWLNLFSLSHRLLTDL